MESDSDYTVFVGYKLLGAGDLLSVAQSVQQHLAEPGALSPLVFQDSNGQQIDIDTSGSSAQLAKRYSQAKSSAAQIKDLARPRARGRPRLGVVGREITLLPRHWQWLDQQRGGASATLRRLIDQARKNSTEKDQIRQSQDRSNRFMSALAGDLPGFEEATRALYGRDKQSFINETKKWPVDVRNYTVKLAAQAFS